MTDDLYPNDDADSPIYPGSDDGPEHLVRTEPALERRSEVGLFTASLETVQQLLFKPGETTQHFVLTGWKTPLVFMLIVSLLANLATIVFSQGMVGVMMFQMGPDVRDAILEQQQQTGAISWVWSILWVPVWMMLISGLFAGVCHGILVITGVVTHPFMSTLRLVLYALGAVSVIVLIPCCGVFMAGVWFLVILVIGLQHLHDTSTGKAVLAVCAATAAYLLVYALWMGGWLYATGGIDQIINNM